MSKKIISILITVAVLLGAMSIGIYAQNLVMTTTRFNLDGNNVLLSNSALEEAVNIDAETAGYIAELFIADMILTDDCTWNSDTYIVDVVTMYDETGTQATAYSVELTEGYVIVSAFADAESLIPEWSDSAQPIYEELDVATDENIVYLGSYEYFTDNGTSVVTDLSGNTVAKSDLVNIVEDSRDISNVSKSLLETCIVRNGGVSLMGDDNYITTPHQHAADIYGGSFSTQSYHNTWGPYIDYYTYYKGDDVEVGYRSAGVITNMILAFCNRFNEPLPSDCYTPGDLMGMVIFEGDRFCDITEYTDVSDDDVDFFIYCAFSKAVGRNVDPSELVLANKAQMLDYLEMDYLLFVKPNGHSTYDSMPLLGFAYTELISQTSGYTKTYLKIADGINLSGRYVDMSTITPYSGSSPYSTGKYAYVHFYQLDD